MQISSNYQKNNISFKGYEVQKSVKHLGNSVYNTAVKVGNEINHKNHSIYLLNSFFKPKTLQIFVFGKMPDTKSLFKKLIYFISSPKITGIVSTKSNFSEHKLKQSVINLMKEYNKLKIQMSNLKPAR
jgi:hypothetical protein